MQYKVTTKTKSFKVSELDSKNDICIVNYESIWNSNASFNLGNSAYDIKSANSWQSKFDIFKDGKDIGDIDYNWKGDIIIRLKNEGNMTKHFVLKCSNMFSMVFQLKDFLTNHLWSIKPQWTWKSMNYSFFITRESGFEEEENEVNESELMVAAIYASILYLKMAAAAT